MNCVNGLPHIPLGILCGVGWPLGGHHVSSVFLFHTLRARPLYPNDADAQSGTRFNAAGEFVEVEVIPCVGAALVFPQPPVAELLHEGLRVVGCEKDLMRTDIMFEAQ